MAFWPLTEPSRKLHRGDAVAWAVLIAAGALLFALCGCDEVTPNCDPYYASKTMPRSQGCRPNE